MTRELEVAVAEMIHEMVPAMEMIRFACSGTEATMHAIRLARAYTGREIILKFEGNYHGFQDYTLWSTYAPWRRTATAAAPSQCRPLRAFPKALRELVITLPFNDFEGFERAMRSYGDQIAAVITEPCQGNCGAIEPQPGFLDLIRTENHRAWRACSSWTKSRPVSGLRMAGHRSDTALPRTWRPTPRPWATAIPIAAFGGKREIMSIIGHGVAQGGTYTEQ